MKKLAINGGNKAVKIPFPHWVWPSKYTDEEKEIIEQYRNGKNCKKGIPEIVDKLEIEFAKYHNSKYALALSSATECLHTAFFAAGVAPGIEVLSPTYTFPATITPIFQLGGIPVLCDCEKETGNILPEDIERKITSKTKVLVITHLWGRPCNMDAIMKIVKKNKLILIEDCSHAHGSKYKEKLVGTFGDISCFSFDSNKMLASGEAGVMIFKNRDYYERSIVYSDFCGRNKTQVTQSKFLNFAETGIGNKFRIHPLGAAQAYYKFQNLKKYNDERNKMLKLFNDGIKKCKNINSLEYERNIYMGAHYGYKPLYKKNWVKALSNCKVEKVKGLKICKSKSSQILNLSITDYIKILNAEGVDVRQTVTPPLHKTYLFKNIKQVYKIFPSFALNKIEDYPKYKKNDMPNSNYYYKYHLSFPTFSFENQKELIEQYLEAIIKIENILLETI